MPLSMEADLRFNNNTTNYSRNFTVSIWKSYSLMRAYENFASVGRLEVLSTLNFSEATSGHPEFFVEKHGSPIFKIPASVPRQTSASANSSTHANVIQHWNWDTALTIPTSQALGLGEFRNVIIANVYHSRSMVTLFAVCCGKKNKIFSKI